jgi:hypothetical protein
MLELVENKKPEGRMELINRLAVSTSPYALLLLQEMLDHEKDAAILGYAHQAMPSVKEQIFHAYKDARVMEKEKAKKEFSKLESAAVQEHIEALLALSAYQSQHGELNPAKRHFAYAYALDSQILQNSNAYDLGAWLFAQYPENVEEKIKEYIQEHNRIERVYERKYPFYIYLFDYSLVAAWIIFIAFCLVTYLDLSQEYGARCGRRTCINWDAAIADDFARIAPMLPREPIVIAILILVIGTGLRLYHYILQSQNVLQNFNWLDEARDNVFEDIERLLLMVFTPRAKKT